MTLTPEQLKQNAAAMVAFADEKPFQYRIVGSSDEWRDYIIGAMRLPDYGSWEYRPKPEPKTRPWSKPDDVPGPVCWLRDCDKEAKMITRVEESGVEFTRGSASWAYLGESCEYSTDRKTWHPCVVTED